MKAEKELCPYCNSANLTENDQGNSFCQDCHHVIQKTSLANTVEFGNLKMLGKVVDKDCKICILFRKKQSRFCRKKT